MNSKSLKPIKLLNSIKQGAFYTALLIGSLFLSISCQLLEKPPLISSLLSSSSVKPTAPLHSPTTEKSQQKRKKGGVVFPSATIPVSSSVSSPVSSSVSPLELRLKALKLKKTKPFPQRLKELNSFISELQRGGGHPLSVRAYLLKAEILLEGKRPKKACEAYHRATQFSPTYKGYGQALRESARCYFKAGDFSRAEEALDHFIEEGGAASPRLQFFFAQMKWRFLKPVRGRELSKLRALSQQLAFAPSALERQKVQREAEQETEALLQKLSSEQKLNLATKASQLFPQLEALLFYRAGNAFFAEKKFNQATKCFKKAKALKLASPYLKLALLRKLKWIERSRRLNPYLIGVIVPLSGKRKALGEKILRGLYMGFNIDQASPWQLAVMDSGSQPDLLRSRLESLFYRHHIVALIGGLGAETAEALAESAEMLALPSLVFSQKMGLSQNRDFVFQNALTADQLLKPLIEKAIRDLKIKEVALLSPDDGYGKEYAGLFTELFEKAGGEVTGTEFYPSKEEDFKKQVKNLLHLNIKGREKEFKKLKEEFLSENPSLSRQSKKLLPENLLSRKQDFSALFIPDSLSRLHKIKDYLKYFGLKNVFLLGTNLWQRDGQSPALNRRGLVEEYPIVFTAPPQENSFKDKAFYRDFSRLYSRPPGLFEQRAYDSALFLKKALAQGSPKTRHKFQSELKKIKSFKGALYKISISADGLFQYPLKVYSQKPSPHK